MAFYMLRTVLFLGCFFTAVVCTARSSETCLTHQIEISDGNCSFSAHLLTSEKNVKHVCILAKAKREFFFTHIHFTCQMSFLSSQMKQKTHKANFNRKNEKQPKRAKASQMPFNFFPFFLSHSLAFPFFFLLFYLNTSLLITNGINWHQKEKRRRSCCFFLQNR